jgi:hypothetical protein
MSLAEKKRAENNTKAMRELQRLPDNKTCMDCPEKVRITLENPKNLHFCEISHQKWPKTDENRRKLRKIGAKWPYFRVY